MTPDPYEEFASFARACQPRLLRVAYLICGDAHLAEDLLQSALFKVALRWSRLRDARVRPLRRDISWRCPGS